MKKNEINFSIPSRQSYVAILMIIYKTYKVLIRQLWPFILIMFLGRSGDRSTTFLYAFGGIALLGMIFSIINFFRYYFYVTDEELIIESGILRRKKLNIPFDRIQTINFEQNFVHAFFSVTGLKIDTAGSAKSEFQFDAIEKSKGEALRSLIMDKKRVIEKESSGEGEIEAPRETVFKKILSLSFADILKIGITENHIRSAGIIILFFFGIYENLNDVGLDVTEYTDEMHVVQAGIIAFFLMAFVFLFAAFIISLLRTIITYFDLTLYRSHNSFKIHSGLFTKKEVSAMDHKIQMIGWSDNPLKKLIGIHRLQIKQASSVAVSAKKSISIPGCTRDQINKVKGALYGESIDEGIIFYQVDIRYMYRRIIYMFLLVLGIGTFGYFQDSWQAIMVAVLFGIYVIISSVLSYRKKKYGYNDEILVIKGGTFGDRTTMLPIYKIQTVDVRQTLYQQRKDLASVIIHSAAGNVHIPYIDVEKAQSIMDDLIYKVEKDRRKWM